MQSPTKEFPYGYGNMQYLSSLISGCAIFAFGGGLSIFQGFHAFAYPTALEPLSWVFFLISLLFYDFLSLFRPFRFLFNDYLFLQAYSPLFLSLLFQATSFGFAYSTVRKKAMDQNISFLKYGLLLHTQLSAMLIFSSVFSVFE